jgi:hypothetical protein
MCPVVFACGVAVGFIVAVVWASYTVVNIID